MATLDWNLLSLIVFYIIIALLLYINRKKITVQSKILFLYKTKRFNRLLRGIANRHPKFWRAFGLLSIPVGFGTMALIFGFLVWRLFRLSTMQQLQLILPFTSTVSVGPVLFVSFWYFIISIFVVILVHEGAHGVVAEAFKQKIKSSGAGLLAIIPLAFVEPDEKKLRRQPAKVQLSIFAAGAMANFVTAAIVLLLSLFLVAPVVLATVEPHGIEIYSVTKGFPAERAGLKVGDEILSLNGMPVGTPSNFSELMHTVNPGDTITLETTRGTFNVTTIKNPKNESAAYVGITARALSLDVKPRFRGRLEFIPKILMYLYNPIAATLPEQGLLQWIFALNLGIGAINLLPLGAIDGGQMANVVLQRKLRNKARARRVFRLLTAASLLLILFNLIGPFIARSVAG